MKTNPGRLSNFLLVVVLSAFCIAHGATVTVDRSVRHQTMLGMACMDNIRNQAASFYDSLVRDFSVIRTSWESDYAHGQKTHLLALRNKGIRHFIMSIWSPPAQWKDNGRLNGGSLLPQYYDEYAAWCIQQMSEFNSEIGIELTAFSFANEPCFSQTYSSCVYDPAQYYSMSKVLGEAIIQQNVTVPLFGPEVMGAFIDPNGLGPYMAPFANGPVSDQHLGAIACHSYIDGVAGDYGSATGWTRIWERIAVPMGLPVWMTETNLSARNIDDALDMASAIHVAYKFGNCQMWLKWNTAQTFGGSDAQALVTQSGVYTHGYYSCAHFGRYARDGSVRVGCESDDPELLATAYDDPTRGWLAVVLINHSTSAKTVALSGSNLPAQVNLFQTTASRRGTELAASAIGSITIPAKSITTLYSTSVPVVATSPFSVNRTNANARLLPAGDELRVFDLSGRSVSLPTQLRLSSSVRSFMPKSASRILIGQRKEQ